VGTLWPSSLLPPRLNRSTYVPGRFYILYRKTSLTDFTEECAHNISLEQYPAGATDYDSFHLLQRKPIVQGRRQDLSAVQF